MASNRFSDALEIVVSEAQYKQLRSELAAIPGGVNRAIVGAINKTLPQGRTLIVRRLHGILAIKSQGNIRRRTTIIRASMGRKQGVVRILARPIALTNFNVKDTRIRSEKRDKATGKLLFQRLRKKAGSGVTAQIYRGGAIEKFPYAFIADGRSGNRHVFERQYRGDKRVARLPIFSRKGVSLLSVFEDEPGLERELTEKVADVFAVQLRSQIDRLLNRRRIDRPDEQK
jgi:hypothetical protein